MTIEAVVLTGGASQRMGTDKASLPVLGTSQAQRIVERLRDKGYAVTVLGREPVPGAEFVQDREEFAGPLAALECFRPTCDCVFVASCDLPLFDAALVDGLAAKMGEAQVAVPILGGWRQPLCALYRSTAFPDISQVLAEGKRSLMAWLDRLRVVEVAAEDLSVAPEALMSANTPEELQALLGRENAR